MYYKLKKLEVKMKNIKTKIRMAGLSVIVILIFSLSVVNINTVATNSEMLSNKKIGWGIKRNDNHEQPDLGKTNQTLLEENKGICLGSNEKKNIYLTFDEGYEAGYTPKILDVLKQNNVKATFFITAHYLNTQSDLVKQMIDEGHIVGNHTVNHKSMPSLTQEQINSEVMDLHKAIYSKFEYEMKYLRPPMGEYSQKTLAVTNSLGYTTVMWSFAYEDWNEKSQPDEEKSKQKILNNVHNGEIMLLHGNSKTNTNILDSIIKQIKQMGYEFKSLDEFE
jgi:peptidoglycan-N-acetylmuramic acid deacetylase